MGQMSNIKMYMEGESNPASLRREMYYVERDDVVTLPAVDPTANAIVAPIVLKTVAPAPTVVWAQIFGSDADIDYKCEAIMEGDNFAGHKVSVKIFLNGAHRGARAILAGLRNRWLTMIIVEKDGLRYLIPEIQVKYTKQVNPKRGYMLEGEIIMVDEPALYNGALISN